MSSTGSLFEELVAIIKKLRDPVSGCPWDKEQTHVTLKPYLIEESYETLDAIDHHPEKIKEELGDVLLQVVLHSQIGADERTFTIDDVVRILSEKLVKRHPHVFGTTAVSGTAEVLQNWEKIKQSDRKKNEGVLAGLPKGMPALLSAHRIGEKVGRVGFDWDTEQGIALKVKEELEEFLEAFGGGNSGEPISTHTREEFGDLLFTIAQLSRKLGINSEEALQQANHKFTKRFSRVEELAERPVSEVPRAELELLWAKVKQEEREK